MALRHGVIVSVQTDFTCTLTMSGDGVSRAGIKYIGIRPKASDTVLILENGNDLVVMGALASGTDWDTYTPALTANSVNPTLGGSGNFIQTGRFTQVGKLVTGNYQLRFGSSGAAAGTGTYSVSLPITADTTLAQSPFIGSGFVFDGSGTTANIICRLSTSTTFTMNHGTANASVTNNSPLAWGAGGMIFGYFAYEAA